ncbi:MAG: TerC family protein [Chthonomonas sp.]|nr:TerC family protein [Chthonomonas sp.]
MPFTFSASDIGTVAVLVLLEILLSVDNALVLAIMVRHLPKDQQKKALLWGLWGAFLLRGTAILFASTIIKFWWLQVIGALYLLWLPLKHFVIHSKSDSDKPVINKPMSFWRTVVAVELMDIAFALDSVLVAVAFVDPSKHPDKMWVVFAGAIMGIIILRLAASVFIGILERYPKLEHLAYALIGWAGLKMTLIGGHNFERAYPNALAFKIPEMSPLVFWVGVGVILLVGGFISFSQRAEVQPGDAAAIEEGMDEMTDEVLEALDGDNTEETRA